MLEFFHVAENCSYDIQGTWSILAKMLHHRHLKNYQTYCGFGSKL